MLIKHNGINIKNIRLVSQAHINGDERLVCIIMDGATVEDIEEVLKANEESKELCGIEMISNEEEIKKTLQMMYLTK